MPKPFYKDTTGNTLPVPLAKPPLILCIEDDPVYLLLRRKVLEEAGYNVIGATAAKDALRVLREAPICAIIADHMLQGISGMDLARKMKKIKPDAPIILFSGSVPERLQNIDVYLNKGEPTAEFLKIVHSVVERYCS